MRGMINWWLLTILLLVLFVPVVSLPFMWTEIQRKRSDSDSFTCNGHMSYLSVVLHRYHEKHGQLPPAYVLGPDGKPWHSWRILILRDGACDGAEVAADYRFDEPWDGPNNRKLHTRMPKYYACPGDRAALAAGRTNYFVVVGPGTVFPGAKPAKFADITRPHNQTILIVEAVGQDINWLEPRDLSFDNMNFETDARKAPTISSKHKYPQAAFVDGSRRYLNDISPFELRQMFLIHQELH